MASSRLLLCFAISFLPDWFHPWLLGLRTSALNQLSQNRCSRGHVLESVGLDMLRQNSHPMMLSQH